MSWARLDDQANHSDKLIALSNAAFRLWVCGLIYCQEKLTDGFIPSATIGTFGVKTRNIHAEAEELCRVVVPGKEPLWTKVDGGYQIHDFLDWNDSADRIRKNRAASSRRVEKHRRRHGDAPRDDEPQPLLNRICNAVTNGVRAAVHAVTVTPVVATDPRTTYQDQKEQEQALRAETPSQTEEIARILRFHRRQRARETYDGKPAVRVIAKLAHGILAESPDIDEHELKEQLKDACARFNLEYDQAIAPAIDRARALLARKRA